MSEKKIKEIEGMDTSANIFTVCGNGCGEFFGCEDPSGKFRPCTTCGFTQKYTCAGIVDRTIAAGAEERIHKLGGRCEFCPPIKTSEDLAREEEEGVPASMSS